jgi:thioredoxin reductase (NADPH)
MPFSTTHVRPTRQEALQYYRLVAERQQLPMRLHTRVKSIERRGRGFAVHLDGGETLAAKTVIVATGYFDFTNRLGVPGEDLPHVSHYYVEPYRYAQSDVLVVGGRNSAVETALELYRHGARVTLVHRREELGNSVKYWVRPDIVNRLKDGSIAAHFQTVITAIRPGEVDLRHADESTRTVKADFVFPLIGYRPDEALLRGAGVNLNEVLIPDYDHETFQTNVPGLYIAGSVACGCETWNIFIENGRAHADPIIRHIRLTLGEARG